MGLELIGSRGCDEAGVAAGSLAGASFILVDMREAVLEVIPDGAIYSSEGITYLDASLSAKETAAEMVLILPEIVGGVIAGVGTIALVPLHDVHRVHTLGMHGGEVFVIDAHLRLDPQSLLVVRIMEEIVAYMERDADEWRELFYSRKSMEILYLHRPLLCHLHRCEGNEDQSHPHDTLFCVCRIASSLLRLFSPQTTPFL